MAIAEIDPVDTPSPVYGVDQGIARWRGADRGAADDVVLVCISDNAEVRAKVAELVCQLGVVVMASDARHAHWFFERALGRNGADPVDDPADELAAPADEALVVSGLVIDRTRHRALWRGVPIELTNQEFELLAHLAGDPDRVWTYRLLHDAVWGSSYLGDTSSLHSAVKRLRSKLRRARAAVGIASVRSVGFRLDQREIDLRD